MTDTDIALDFDSLVEHLTEIVREKGYEYVYTTDPETVERRKEMLVSQTQCLYTGKDGKPGCIIGHLIHKLKPEFDLESVEFKGAAGAFRAAGLAVGFKSREFFLLGSVQGFQDNGYSWGYALEQGIAQSKQDYNTQ